MSKSLIVIVMLAVAAPAVARQASPGAHPNTRLGALRAKKSAAPFQKLFDVPRGVGSAISRAVSTAAEGGVRNDDHRSRAPR